MEISTPIIKSSILTTKEQAFIDGYLTHGNASQAVLEAGYKTKAPSRYASDLLRKDKIRKEMQQQLAQRDAAKVAAASEILQFYTSVMRGEVLDQFGIEAALDTRLKAANELAKHQIELPMKLEQKNITNNIGTIQLNFLPRKMSNNEEISEDIINS